MKTLTLYCLCSAIVGGLLSYVAFSRTDTPRTTQTQAQVSQRDEAPSVGRQAQPPTVLKLMDGSATLGQPLADILTQAQTNGLHVRQRALPDGGTQAYLLLKADDAEPYAILTADADGALCMASHVVATANGPIPDPETHIFQFAQAHPSPPPAQTRTNES